MNPFRIIGRDKPKPGQYFNVGMTKHIRNYFPLIGDMECVLEFAPEEFNAMIRETVDVTAKDSVGELEITTAIVIGGKITVKFQRPATANTCVKVMWDENYLYNF
ncbi:hypothetical protein fHeYen902_273 [Yersinia phage fHe-Yen9-02]|nr:hypothetical protein fHeYen902_273 [Yersinia phage fHe-Yen9-02]